MPAGRRVLKCHRHLPCLMHVEAPGRVLPFGAHNTADDVRRLSSGKCPEGARSDMQQTSGDFPVSDVFTHARNSPGGA